ncbi:glycosyltransferase family 4 protein [Acetatifactor aquisgranensis]|uniref:glycosyltransferase family 4 protein n=1 Tax=Acetatifactor aquisgranensis TaxID=2941233 RepID=UPI00204141E7|nr:glycosyltransferase family 4 protein [Acetatifactor aquisgranensis]
MNILFVTGLFANDERDTALGGMPGAVYKSALGMQQRGHSVRILACAGRERRWRYQGLDVISVRVGQGIEEKAAGAMLIDILKRELAVRRYVQKLDCEKAIDIVQYTGWFGVGLLHPCGIPAVMRMSSYTKVQLSNNFSTGKRFLLEAVEYLAAKRMNFVFAPSRITAAGLEKDIQRAVVVMETPFRQEETKWDDSILRSRLESKRYLLFFGRMTVDKGIYVIRDMLHEILDRYREIHIVFAGGINRHEGVLVSDELMEAAGEHGSRVVFLGLLPKERLLPVIDGAELILMPSLADNFPNACAEAMSLGKIVIGTDGSSLEQFIQDGVNGYLVERNNPGQLCRCVDRVLRMEPGQKELVSIRARKKIEGLDLESYSKKMEKIYTRVIKLQQRD